MFVLMSGQSEICAVERASRTNAFKNNMSDEKFNQMGCKSTI